MNTVEFCVLTHDIEFAKKYVSAAKGINKNSLFYGKFVILTVMKQTPTL